MCECVTGCTSYYLTERTYLDTSKTTHESEYNWNNIENVIIFAVARIICLQPWKFILFGLSTAAIRWCVNEQPLFAQMLFRCPVHETRITIKFPSRGLLHITVLVGKRSHFSVALRLSFRKINTVQVLIDW